jgi:hypothetical protein
MVSMLDLTRFARNTVIVKGGVMFVLDSVSPRAAARRPGASRASASAFGLGAS